MVRRSTVRGRAAKASEPEVVSKTAVSLREVLVAKYSYTPEVPGQNFLRIENSPTRCIP
jgi:hypothetical protein